jgi:hypothetical protein
MNKIKTGGIDMMLNSRVVIGLIGSALLTGCFRKWSSQKEILDECVYNKENGSVDGFGRIRSICHSEQKNCYISVANKKEESLEIDACEQRFKSFNDSFYKNATGKGWVALCLPSRGIDEAGARFFSTTCFDTRGY